jgi:hypothetical protein
MKPEKGTHHSWAFQDSVVVADDCEVVVFWFQR